MSDFRYSRLVKSDVEFEDLFDGVDSNDQTIEAPKPSETNAEKVDKNEIDYAEFSTYVQGFYFDLYGTNVPQEKMQDIFNALPQEVDNESLTFNNQLMKTFADLKSYEWLEISNNDTYTSQEMMQDAEEISNSDDLSESYDEVGEESGDFDSESGDGGFDDSDDFGDEGGSEDDADDSGVKSVLPASNSQNVRRASNGGSEEQIVSRLAAQLIANGGHVDFEM